MTKLFVKNYKRLIFILLALVLVFAFVGCGDTADDEKTKETDAVAYVDPDDDGKNLLPSCYLFAHDFMLEKRDSDENCVWDHGVTQSDGNVALYTPEGNRCGFLFKLKNGDEPVGYIQVMFFDDGKLFIEDYSYESKDLGFLGINNNTIYIGDGEYLRKNDNEDFYRSTRTAATYTLEEVESNFNELKAKYK